MHNISLAIQINIICTIQIDFNNSESWFFIPKESKPIETELFFHVASVKYISFVKIKKIDNIKEVKLIEQYFLEENVFDQWEIEFIIPFSKLKLVKSFFPLDLTMVQNEDTVYLIKELSRSKKVEWSIDLNDGLENIELWLTHLPSYCYYNIDWFSSSSLNILSFKNTDEGFLLFSKIKLNELKIFCKISAKEIILIKNLLELENIKNSLQSITIYTQAFIEALEILDLWTEWREIQSITLSYSSAWFSKIVVTKKTKNAKRKLCSKVGFINKFSILQV